MTVHDSEAHPLYANLRDPQEPGETLKPRNLPAACQISTTGRKDKYVSERGGPRSGAEEDEVG